MDELRPDADADALVERPAAAVRPDRTGDYSITRDGRVLDTKEKVIAFIAEDAQRRAEADARSAPG